jgi:SAM-dependent methyltransferase
LEEAKSGIEAPIGFACIQAIGESLPLANESFDCVLMSEVIEHLEAPQISICEAVRVLRPGGRLLITTPNYRSFWPLMEWAVDRLNMTPKMAGEQHISRFYPSSLNRMLVESGLNIEYSGSIYNLSPFLSLVSSEQAKRQLQRELRARSILGMILVAVAVKP